VPHALLVRVFYDNLLLVVGLMLPVGVALLFAVIWTRGLGVRFGPDVPLEVESRWWLASTLRSLGFALPEEGMPPRPKPSPPEPRGRRVLRLGLVLLWLVGAGLTSQAEVGTGAFLRDTLEPLLRQGPGWFQTIGDAGLRLWGGNPVAVGVAAVMLQLLAAGLLVVDSAAGAVLSGLLGLVRWVMVEGLGGLPAGASFLGRAPGAGLLVLLASVLLLKPAHAWRTGVVPRRTAELAGVLWIAGAALQVAMLGRPWRASLLTRWLAFPQPPPVVAPLVALTGVTARAAVLVNLFFALCMAVFGAVLLTRRSLTGAWAAAAAAWLGCLWWVTGDFGGLWTGRVMDPGTPLVWGLLLASCSLRERPSTQGRRGGIAHADT
jgi:hypothetical protein